MKKLISVVLALVLALSSFAMAASASAYNDIPCVIVPGIGQSRAWLVDDNGNFVLNGDGEKIHCFPGNFDVQKILGDVAAPLAKAVATQSDSGLADALCDAVENAFYMNKTDDFGQPCGYVEVETYPHSLAECTQDELNYIFDCIPMQELGKSIGFDNMYYYAYNSFGNAIDMINGLYDFIQMVKQQTGKDKVNIIPISMGGAIFNGLMELHPEVANDLHRIIFVVPALNGSLIVSDIYERELTFLNPDYLYSEFFDGILDETTASAIEIALRVLPKDVLMNALNKTVDMLLTKVFANCTALWMLVPNDQYDKCVQMNLSSNSKKYIRAQTDVYHRAQTNSNKNILKFKSQGVEVFDVLGYDVPLYNVGNSWNKQNADGVIHTYSTSIGAYMANCGETLPADYVQKNTYCKASSSAANQSTSSGLVDKILFKATAVDTTVQCSDPSHNHISPDRVVDASTGLLPDTTFYFDNQPHATANQNDIIMKLCCELVETDRITDVYSDPNFPQFNQGRATKVLREELLPAAEAVDKSSLSATDRRALESAVNDANSMLSRTIAVEGEAPRVEQKLRSVLENIGAIEPQSDNSSLGSAVKTVSDTLVSLAGANGFSDIVKDYMANGSGSENGEGESSDSGNGSGGSSANTNGSGSNGASGNNGSSGSSGGSGSSSNSGSSNSSGSSGSSAKSPKTSGESFNYLPVALIALAAVIIIALVIYRKKSEDFYNEYARTVTK